MKKDTCLSTTKQMVRNKERNAHVNTHAYRYTYTHLHTFTYIHIHTHTYTYIHLHTPTYTYLHLFTLAVLVRHNVCTFLWEKRYTKK